MESVTTVHTASSSLPAESEPKKPNTAAFFIVGAFVGVIIGSILSQAVFKNTPVVNATISGSIQYNGLKPVSSIPGKIVLMQRQYNSDQPFITANNNVALAREAPWSWETAVSGNTYEIQAWVEVNGEQVASSNIITVTAPATEQVLEFNVTRENLEVKKIPPSELRTFNNVVIAGTLDLNGYIPSGSTVRVVGKNDKQTEYHLSSEIIPAEDGRQLAWEAADSGEIYDFIGLLADSNGNEIGRSSLDQVVAPSEGNVLSIQSFASPPVANQKASISGSLQINGPIEEGSVVTMRQKLASENSYQDFLSLTAVNGATWSWTDADVGVLYDITAVLINNNQEVALGNLISVVAPAAGEQIVINTGIPPEEILSSPGPTTTPAIPTPLPSPNPSLSPLPTATAIPSPTPSPTSPATVGCSVNYSIGEEKKSDFSATVNIKNNSSSPINSWTLTWTFADGQKISSMWSATYSQNGSRVTANNDATSVPVSPNGGTKQFGFNATYKTANTTPTDFNLNGQACDTY